MGKKIAVIHTSLAVREKIDHEIRRQIPDADIHNIIDEKLLSEVMERGGIDSDIIKRMTLYVQAADSMGADIIFNACSSVGEAFELAGKLTDIPCLKIDQAMAEQAAAEGCSIAVYGTVATTLDPSARLIQNVARDMGKEVTVTPHLIDGAFQILQEQGPQKHNEMVLAKIRETHEKHDVIVLAQASMSVLIPEMGDIEKPVLYSVVSGVERLKMMLEGASK